MKKVFIFPLFVSAALFAAARLSAAAEVGGLHITGARFEVPPVGYDECMQNRAAWGLKNCLRDAPDYLAGAAKICGNLRDLPTAEEAQKLAALLYNAKEDESAVYGQRNNALLKKTGLPVSYDHIYIWLAGETADGKGGYIRMLANDGSIPYQALRDGSGYLSACCGLIRFDNPPTMPGKKRTDAPNASVICLERNQ